MHFRSLSKSVNNLVTDRSPGQLECLYLIDEAGEAVVEALDLLLLVGPAHGQAGVDLQVEGRQQALVDRQGGQRGTQAVLVPVGPRVERAAAQGDAAEAAVDRAEAAQPPRPAAAAPDGGAGADALGTTQTHGGRLREDWDGLKRTAGKTGRE